ncbi:MAG TPA: PIG-L family deacetylase [Pyrinomonadaceae bacterium]|nr:PIG-L family deacetylase [Pyrinomonadaceae bacterium]
MSRHAKPCAPALSLVSLLALLFLPHFVGAQPRPVMNAAETQLALRKLTVLGSVLYVAAHPDDENTAMLSYFSNERLTRTAYLSVTRGDGGQNLIGPEQGELLGVLRTQELLAARRLDGAEQFFTRAVDFGFSKSPEETFKVWGKEQVLADVVWVIRRFRPDVIVTRFPTSGAGGHGQHTASAVLAHEAFRAAADSARFPEQLQYVRPWQPKRLLWNFFSRTAPGERKAGEPKLLRVDLGAYNSLLGRSYTEIAAQSRSMHKSQGFGSAERRGAAVNYLEHVIGEPPADDTFDGVDTSWRRVAGGEAVGKILEEAARSYDPAAPQKLLPALLRAHAEMSKLPSDDAWVGVKQRELLEVIRACAGLWVEAVASDFAVTPAGEARITVTVVNRSDFPLRVESVRLAPPGVTTPVNAELKNNEPVTAQLSASLMPDHPYSQPYWLWFPRGTGLYTVADQRRAGEPENPPAILAVVNVSDGTQALRFETPVLYRWTDRVRGEQYRPVEVAPLASVRLEERTYVFPEAKPKTVRVYVRANAASLSGRVRLRLPAAWRATPEAFEVSLKEKDDEQAVSFEVTPPAAAQTATLGAAFDLGQGRVVTHNVVRIEYPHVPPQTVFPPAEARLVRADIARRGSRVGYVSGPGDEVPQALRQLGYEVVLLSDEDLAADLSGFDAVVTGVRAYNTRAALRRNNQRLLEYVRQGGTLVVQYNTMGEGLPADLGPQPFKLSNERVTVEESPVALVSPEHALLNAPNKITPADFEGWVQERGLYFPNDWHPSYETPLASADPGEPPKRGGTLFLRHGRGAYVYTSFAWFRQLPAGVPGAYKLFANMVSAGKN